jgi:hypothetical protein
VVTVGPKIGTQCAHGLLITGVTVLDRARSVTDRQLFMSILVSRVRKVFG